MAKLYQRQNIQLSRGPIIQPEKQPSIGAAVAKFGADTLDKIAKDNFALGHANLTNDIVNTAYTANPMNLKRFNEMVQSGIEKSTKNLPGDMARQIRLSAEKKANAFTAKIESNIRKAATAELEQNAQTLSDNITNGPNGLQDSNVGMMDCLINRDTEGLKKFRENWNYQHQQLSSLADLKNPIDGSYVIGKEATRNMYKQGLFGKMDAFRAAIEKLSKDGLKKFDEEVFQDKKFFTEAYGIDDKSYDDMEKLIKARRKAFDDQDKRVIKDQAYFEMSKLSQIDPAVLDDIEKSGVAKPETLKEIRKAIKEAQKTGNPNAANYLDQNESFLAGLAELQDAISTDDGSPEYNDRLLQTAAKISQNISKMHRNGLGDEQTQILNQALSGIVSDQNFAGALDFSDSFLLSEIVRGAQNDYYNDIDRQKDVIKKKYPLAEKDGFQKSLMESELKSLPERTMFKHAIIDRPVRFTSNTQKALKEMAARYSAQIIALEQIGQHDQAMELKQAANKELIYLKYSDWIPRHEFDRMEHELTNGRKAYTTIGNSVFEYKGLSNNGVILEGEF